MLTLATDQQQAVDKFIHFIKDTDEKEMVLIAGSGYGKTTSVIHMVDTLRKIDKLEGILLQKKLNTAIHYTGLTNKAAKVLSIAVGEEASTIHTLLGLRVVDNYKTGTSYLKKTKDAKIIENSIVFVDEASMADESLVESIRKNTMNCRVVYILDDKQLLPIFESTCTVTNGVTIVAELQTIKRQAKGNSIIQLGQELRSTVDTLKFPSFKAITPNVHHLSGDQFKAKVSEIYLSKDYADDPDEAKIICYTNKRVKAYNQYIREIHNQTEEFVIGEWVITNNPIMAGADNYAPTDSTLQITSITPETYYGLDGYSVELDNSIHTFLPKDGNQMKQLMKEYAALKNWHDYFEVKNNMADLRPAHSITAFKAQGSTYRNVFIDLHDIGSCKNKATTARMLYVACTRPTDNLFIYGDLPSRYY